MSEVGHLVEHAGPAVLGPGLRRTTAGAHGGQCHTPSVGGRAGPDRSARAHRALGGSTAAVPDAPPKKPPRPAPGTDRRRRPRPPAIAASVDRAARSRRWLALLAILLGSSFATTAKPASDVPYYRLAVFPRDLVNAARGQWFTIDIGIRRALRQIPWLDVAYAYDDELARLLGARPLSLKPAEIEALWIKDSPYLVGTPDYDLVVQIAERIGVDAVLTLAMDLSIEQLNSNGFFIAEQRTFLIDARAGKAYVYRAKGPGGSTGTLSTGAVARAVATVLDEFRDDHRASARY